jgi:hypothetical protein
MIRRAKQTGGHDEADSTARGDADPIGTRIATTRAGSTQSAQDARCSAVHRCEPGTISVQACPGSVWSERYQETLKSSIGSTPSRVVPCHSSSKSTCQAARSLAGSSRGGATPQIDSQH